MHKKPVPAVTIEAHTLSAEPGFPNNSKLPLLVYRQVLRETGPTAAADIERLFEMNGWKGTWRNGIYTYHHYHSEAHEVLGVAAGRASVQFGGPSGPTVAIEAGDVAVLPAGTAHKCVEASSDLLVVGGYPAGQEDYDIQRGDPDEQTAAERRITSVPLPKADPVYGADGPLFEHWRE